MLLTKETGIMIFILNSYGTFEHAGEVNQYTSLVWPEVLDGFGTFELWCPITEENNELLQKGRIVWCGGDNAAIIEIRQTKMDENGIKTLNIKGRTLEMLLTTRIVWDTYNASNKTVSTIMYEIVRRNCIKPLDEKRKIPFLEVAEDKNIGKKISYQQTGGEVYEALKEITKNSNLGFRIIFKPKEQKLIFEVYEGENRTIEQEENVPVVMDTEMEDILSSDFYENTQDIKNIALVAGEGEGLDRIKAIAGNEENTGFDRKEMYIDARDLQSETDEGEEKKSMTPEEYMQLLIDRGVDKLSECQEVVTYEAHVRVQNNVQYEYGKDYFLGDKITIRDSDLRLQLSAIVTQAEQQIDDENKLALTLGYSYPTLWEKIKRKI